MERLLRLLSTLLLITLASASYAKSKVIYGKDNRVDVFESKRSDYVELSKSTAAMISTKRIRYSSDTNSYKIKTKTLQEVGVCKEERFSKQPIAPSCSGFLVGDKYLVTAGHCIKDEYDCAQNKWVFNYKMLDENSANTTPSFDEVYDCKTIISRSLDIKTKNDFALIELDRVVTVARPLKFRRHGKVSEGDELVVIGHPSGLPTKIADQAVVRKVNDIYFSANLDTYGGNSGSAVFNANTGVVEGILVRGDLDYISGPDGCRVSNVNAETSGRGEDVTLISVVEKLMDL